LVSKDEFERAIERGDFPRVSRGLWKLLWNIH